MYKDGSAGELEPFNEKKLKKMLEKEGDEECECECDEGPEEVMGK